MIRGEDEVENPILFLNEQRVILEGPLLLMVVLVVAVHNAASDSFALSEVSAVGDGEEGLEGEQIGEMDVLL